ncbi:MAG: flagellum-specific ATP synthase FliI, partial [Angelakisella sp.]
LMSDIATREHKGAAAKLRNMLAVYNTNQDLISIGAYKSGSNPELDYAITHYDRINDFLQQQVDEKTTLDQTVQQMVALLD